MAKEIALELLKILEEETDKGHKLSKEQLLQELLDRYNTDIEDKSFYRKIQEIEAAGFAIEKTRGNATKYYLNIERLTEGEILYLSALILGNSDLSEKEAGHLLRVIGGLPRHNSALHYYKEYKEKFKTNHSRTNQMGKFSLLVEAIEKKQYIRYKQIVEEGEDGILFSELQEALPKDFNIVNNHIQIVLEEAGTQKNIFLTEIIDVEIIEKN